MQYSNYGNQYINLEVPVSYTIKKSLIEDMLTTLPHQSISDKNGSLIIKFSNSNFIFSQPIIDKFSLMKHQVIPAIFLSNSLGKPNYIYIDSNIPMKACFNSSTAFIICCTLIALKANQLIEKVSL